MKIQYKKTLLEQILQAIDRAKEYGREIDFVEVSSDEFESLLLNLKTYGIVNYGVHPKAYYPKEERYVFVDAVEVKEVK